MILSIASGKGGTGKTTVAVNLALSVSADRKLQLLDCDVEGPNAHFFISAEFEKEKITYLPYPEIDENKCTYCGRCAEVCAYNALAVLKENVLIFPELCHGCGACKLFCPENAIKEIGRRIGVIRSGHAGNIFFLSGKLDVGQAMSPPLIRQMKKMIDRERDVILDVPPGTSCPMVEAVKGSDHTLLVTEPTPFGLNDLKLSVDTLGKMGIPFSVILNRARTGDDIIHEYCQKENIPLVMEIPLDRKIAEAYSKGETLIDLYPNYKNKFLELYNKLKFKIKTQHEDLTKR
ncbi:MAG: ATP-binding protein [Candidatus Aminicenantes bacterium]|nr:ATP-binding protein [Candidatus Aminicenantes bacterium]